MGNLFTRQPMRTGNGALDLALNVLQGALEAGLDTAERMIRAVLEPEVVRVDSDYTCKPTDDVIEYVGSGGHTIVLPSAARVGGRRSRPLLIVNNSAGTTTSNGPGPITIAVNGGDEIRGGASNVGSIYASNPAVSTSTALGVSGAAMFIANGVTAWTTIGARGRLSTLTVTEKLAVWGTAVFVQVVSMQAGLVLSDNQSVTFGTIGAVSLRHNPSGAGTGLVIGTAAADKIGLHGATPTAQLAAITAPTGGATVDTEARTAINALIDRIKTKGITA